MEHDEFERHARFTPMVQAPSQNNRYVSISTDTGKDILRTMASMVTDRGEIKK